MSDRTMGSHEGLRHLLDKAADVLGGVVGRAEAKTAGAHSDSAFVESAAVSNLYEIAAAELALQRSTEPAVRGFARKMIDDHRTAANQMRSALRMGETAGVPAPPTQVDERRRTMLDHLHKAPDGSFARDYLDQQVAAHQESLDLMTGYRGSGGNAQLRSLAGGAAPVVARHLALAKELRAAAG